MICCWIEKPNSNEFRQHLPRIHDFLWLGEDGMKSKVLFLYFFVTTIGNIIFVLMVKMIYRSSFCSHIYQAPL
jgi:hypothetical protein